MEHSLAVYCLLLCSLYLLILFDIVNQLAIWIMACVKMWTVSEAFVCILINNRAKMFFIAIWVPLCFLTFISCAVITILQILFGLELHRLNFLGETYNILKLDRMKITLASISIFSAKREGALRRFYIICLCYFSLLESSFLCCWKVMGSGGGVIGLKFRFFIYSS
jgi:hypothetical protein